MTGYSYVDSVIHIFWVKIFNFSIGFIWLNVMYIIHDFFAPHCNSTVPLVNYCVITKEPLYSVSYFYAVWLVSMTLSPTLWS